MALYENFLQFTCNLIVIHTEEWDQYLSDKYRFLLNYATVFMKINNIKIIKISRKKYESKKRKLSS